MKTMPYYARNLIVYRSLISLMLPLILIVACDWNATESSSQTPISSPAKGFEISKMIPLRGDPENVGSHEIISAVFSHDGKKIVTTAEDGFARVWDANSGAQLLVINSSYQDAPRNVFRSASFSYDNKKILTGGKYGDLNIWDAFTGAKILSKNYVDQVRFASFSPEGNKFVITTSWSVEVCDARDGRTLLTIKKGLKGVDDLFLFASFSPNGKKIVTTALPDKGQIWDAADGKELVLFKAGANFPSFSPDSKRIVALPNLLDAITGRILIELNISKFESADFSPDGNEIVTTHRRGSLNGASIFDANNGSELLVLDGPKCKKGDAFCYSKIVKFSPDGSKIVAGSRSQGAWIWFLTKK
jgi:WD40 repeat protein